MAGALFRYTNNVIYADLCVGVFHKFLNGYILPFQPIQAGTYIELGKVFLQSFLIGRFAYINGKLCGYYFTSHFKTKCEGSYLLSYLSLKSGSAKRCNRVYNDENLVILEYPNCGTLAIYPKVSDSIQTIFEEQ